MPDELQTNWEELRKALEDAFAREADLQLAVRETLDRSLEDVKGDTRRDKIFNLLLELSSQGLLVRALSRLWWTNPGARRLRQNLIDFVGVVLGEDALIGLTNLSCFKTLEWSELEPRFDELIKLAGKTRGKLGIPSIQTAGQSERAEQLVMLTTFKLPQQEDPAIVPFLQWVAQRHPSHASPVEAWLDRFASQRVPLAAAQASTRLLLIFDEVADGAFDVTAWHGRDAASLKPFEYPQGSRMSAIALGELQLAFDQICKAFGKRLGSFAGVQVEVVLPIGRMQVLEPETWKVQLKTPAPGPLWARRMCLCRRPLERFFGRGDYEFLDHEWKESWSGLSAEPAKTLVLDVTAYEAAAFELDEPAVSAQLVGSSKIGAVIDPVLRAGYAIVLWVRQDQDANAARALLGSLVQQGHQQLLAAVHAHRRAANAEQLVLLWDDPNFRPPPAPDLGIDQ